MIGDDRPWMQRALKLAALGQGFVEPNPMVGCVIVKEGQLLSEGYHRRFGGDHAEVDAIRRAEDTASLIGSTAYVTLEPCCHFGKTPPCVDALIQAKVSRVVAAMTDPFAQVQGQGFERLRGAGIEVQVGVCEAESRWLNAAYLKRLQFGRPWVIAKWAMSLDGKIATSTGDSQWISGEASRGEVHRLRGVVDAIIVGGGTAIADNPTLTARPAGPRRATRIVLVGNRLPRTDAKLFQTIEDAPVMLVRSQSLMDSNPLQASQVKQLQQLGAKWLVLPAKSPQELVENLLDELGKQRFTNVLVEGGGSLLDSFFQADEADELRVFIAPKVIGGSAALGPVEGTGFAKLSAAPQFHTVHATRWDDDYCIVSRRSRRKS